MVMAIDKVLEILEVFKSHNTEMPLQQIETLMQVAKRQPTTVTELCRWLPQAPQSVARNVRILTVVANKERDGYGLVEQILDVQDSRRRHLQLTGKGERLVKELEAVVSGGD
jgi:DNA-binding MarR family transcriptional regulator